jgi:hypothetical protein
MNPETLSAYPRRLTINRNSAYSPPKWAEDLVSGALPSFDTRQCTAGIVAKLDPTTPQNPAFIEHSAPTYKQDGETIAVTQEKNAEELFNRIQEYAFVGQSSTAAIPAPSCEQQRPLQPIYGDGPATQYQHTFEQP